MNRNIQYSSRIRIPDLDFLPIPDPGVKKAPDPGSGSTTVLCSNTTVQSSTWLTEQKNIYKWARKKKVKYV